MTQTHRSGRRGDEGAVLIVVLMVILGLLGLGLTAYWLTSGNLNVAANMNLRTQAMWAAEAGLERARSVLNATTAPNMTQLLTGQNAGAGDNVPTGLLPSGLPNGVGAIFVDGTTALRALEWPDPAYNLRSAGTATQPVSASMGRYTVWIRNDTAEIRLGRYTNDTDGTVVLRSQGLAPDGRTQVILEQTMVPASVGNPSISAPVAPNSCHSGKNACDDNSSTFAGVVGS